ncbi:MAG: Xaa-Pro peptidase family protein [Rhodospirillales bacterium]|nr:Xaa-Pro peptidase family protein [Rhodospirillales bacterium]
MPDDALQRETGQGSVGGSGTAAMPFDIAKLDRLMEEAGLDALLVTSKHNVQYLLGGHRAQFFSFMDAMGISRYLPVLVYPKGAPEKTIYIGHRLERYQLEVGRFWVPEMRAASSGSVDAMERAVEAVRKLGLAHGRIGVERPFLPMDAAEALRAGLPEAGIGEALVVLERLRAIKSAREITLLREASERIIASMLAVMARHGAGSTKREIAEDLKCEEASRGLDFEYCLITAGTSLNRAPAEERWEKGQPLSLDSGGNYRGYIGDLTRMAVLGEPDAELEELLGKVEEVQQKAFRTIAPGRPGGDIFAESERAMAGLAEHDCMHFMAHGMGMISHEAPRLPTGGQMTYPAVDAKRPLEPGMVLSVETTMAHPKRGFIKLEDTVAVTAAGWEILGEGARGWNRGGTAAG